jgi:hypothetical protein
MHPKRLFKKGKFSIWWDKEHSAWYIENTPAEFTFSLGKLFVEWSKD